MTKNTSVMIGDHFEGFIAQSVASGRYSSASDVMRAALRLLESNERRLSALRSAIAEGDASPESEDIDGKQAFTALREKFGFESRNG